MIDTKKIAPIRILIVDDNPSIHKDFEKIYPKKEKPTALENLGNIFFPLQATQDKDNQQEEILLDSAFQGQEALEYVKKAVKENRPYPLAFIDARMPNGWNGIETIQQLWKIDPDLQIVICTAFADYTWDAISQALNHSENFLILKKPFEITEIRQLVSALIQKWQSKKDLRLQIESLENIVQKNASALAKAQALMKSTLESSAEGILIINKDKTFIFNKAFASMWDLPITDDNKKVSDLLREISALTCKAEAFHHMLNNLCNRPAYKMRGANEWELKNGNTYEVYSKPHYLHTQIIGCILTFKDRTEQKKLEMQLAHQATHDSLTQLPNRMYLMNCMEQSIDQAKFTNTHLGVLIIDVVNFKSINVDLGHDIGNNLLTLIAERLKNVVRKTDTVVRFDSDEFVVILNTQKNINDTLTKANEFIALFQKPFQIDEHTITVAVNVGISHYPEDGQNAALLLKSADIALTHAKKTGGNTSQVYICEYSQQLLRRAELNVALIQALGKQQFILEFQPLYQLENKKILGFEILLRWQHPKLGVVFPDKFIALAEETGLIAPIGEWVLHEAIKQLQIWQKKYDKNLIMAVNISGYQFNQHDFVHTMTKVIQSYPIDPHTLELELTENIAFKNIPETAEKLNQLKKLGVRLAIDDFGMGDLSFAYLKHLPCDKVKIDKSFIQGIYTNKYDEAIVEAIVRMTKKMGIEILAEGVEQEAQIVFLKENQVDQVQGYLYSPPVSPQECEKLLLGQKDLLASFK